MEYIQGGALGDILKRLWESLLKSLDGVFDNAETKISYQKGRLISESITENEVLDENGEPLSRNSAEFHVTITLQWPEDDVLDKKSAEKILNSEDTWMNARTVSLKMTFKGSNPVSKSNISYKNALKEIDKYSLKHDLANNATHFIWDQVLLYNEGKKQDSESQDTNSSRKLNISLIKISGSEDIEINLTRINANYDLLEAIEDVGHIVSDDAFIEQLPENEEVCYEITSDDTEYDVNECESFSCEESIQQMIAVTMQAIIDINMIRITASGTDYEMILNSCDTIHYQLVEIMNALSDTLYDMEVPSLSDFNFYSERMEYGRTDVSDLIVTKMKTFLECLDVVYDNCSKGVQSRLESCIRCIEDAIRTSKKRS